MINLWTEMYRGMGFAAVAIGFLFFLGVVLLLLGGIGWSILALMRNDEPDREVTDNAGEQDPYDRCDPYSTGCDPAASCTHANAPRVGRHVRKGA